MISRMKMRERVFIVLNAICSAPIRLAPMSPAAPPVPAAQFTSQTRSSIVLARPESGGLTWHGGGQQGGSMAGRRITAAGLIAIALLSGLPVRAEDPIRMSVIGFATIPH